MVYCTAKGVVGVQPSSTGDRQCICDMSERSRVAEFVSFCVETFANAKGRSGFDVFRLFEACGLVDYLDEGYEVLHTQGSGWLLSDMEDYLRVRGVAA